MRWEYLTARTFRNALKTSRRTCVLPLGILEKHGEHLPIGTDLIIAHETACRAAEKEPAVVFPFYYFTQIFEARHEPGAIAIKPELMSSLLENVCDEIGRNGFRRILLLNAHGGNNHFLPYFVQCSLNEKKDYAMYYSDVGFFDLEEPMKKIFDTWMAEHAGEQETSLMLSLAPEHVRMKDLPARPGLSRNWLKHLGPLLTSVGWYSQFPDHYAGYGSAGTREKGDKCLDLFVNFTAGLIRKVKKDDKTLRLQNQFAGRINKF